LKTNWEWTKPLTLTNTIQWTEATAAIETAERVLLVTHINPDGDAIGSLLAMAHLLRGRGKEVDAAVDGGVPDYLQFLPGTKSVLPGLTRGRWDVMISLDSSDEKRTGECGEYGRAHSTSVINVDHHATNTGFGNLQLVLPEVASTAEVLLEWFNRLGEILTPEVATALLTGIVTDTRGFRTSATRPSTLAAAQRLMDAGASLTEITARTLDSRPYRTIELWKRVLPSVQLSEGVASAVITEEDFKAAQLPDMSDGGLVNFLISADEAMIAIVFREHDGKIDVSMRAKPGFDVAATAFANGGGGHKQAAGMTMYGALETAKAQVLPMLVEAARQGTLTLV
jgi:phosphoesterase RecJ-like protein